ncbi:hypothetical protein AVEN_221182-1 [Araneus ventricosus]|uniref:Uncharacterized protein n=1 Tax=Araneus ventricosus TaxID=182803 RepID=A0A4Y2I3N2_ARAVE|nr:hypothetical protein AVEN_221182-1 [Araneus ventricosus]
MRQEREANIVRPLHKLFHPIKGELCGRVTRGRRVAGVCTLQGMPEDSTGISGLCLYKRGWDALACYDSFSVSSLSTLQRKVPLVFRSRFGGQFSYVTLKRKVSNFFQATVGVLSIALQSKVSSLFQNTVRVLSIARQGKVTDFFQDLVGVLSIALQSKVSSLFQATVGVVSKDLKWPSFIETGAYNSEMKVGAHVHFVEC